jgi:hypothetical protein
LPMRISVSVTPAPRAGGVAAVADTTSAAAKNDTIRLAFVVVCIDMASNAKLARACDAYSAAAMIARKMALSNPNVVADRNPLAPPILLAHAYVYRIARKKYHLPTE